MNDHLKSQIESYKAEMDRLGVFVSSQRPQETDAGYMLRLQHTMATYDGNPTPQDGGKQEHSKLPWTYYPALTASENHRGFWIQAGEGRKAFMVAQVMPLDEDGIAGESNAAFIVSSVNSNAGMRERVKNLEACLQIAMRTAYAGIQGIDDEILERWAEDTSVNPDTRANCEEYLEIQRLRALTPPQENKA